MRRVFIGREYTEIAIAVPGCAPVTERTLTPPLLWRHSSELLVKMANSLRELTQLPTNPYARCNYDRQGRLDMATSTKRKTIIERSPRERVPHSVAVTLHELSVS